MPYKETVKYVQELGLTGYSDVVSGSTVPEHMALLNDARVWSIVGAFLEE